MSNAAGGLNINDRSARSPMSDWQPIKTAPRNGTIFIGWWLKSVRLVAWNREVDNWQEFPDGDFEVVPGELSHWMPLPNGPT